MSSETWKPHKGAQTKFHQANAFEVGYGGAAGGGKTESLLREVLRQIHKPGYKAILFRRTYPELENSLIERSYDIYPGHGGRAKDKGRRWYFRTEGRDSTIIFSHLEHESSVHNHQSAEYDVVGFDEATSFSEYQYTYMRSRVRGTNPDIQRYMLLGTNPGNIGHTWFKNRFIDGKEPFRVYYFKIVRGAEVSCEKGDPESLSRVFIPAKVWDNPTLIQNDPGYVNRLKSLDDTNRRMLLEGDWDVFAGQYFQEFRRETHVVDPFEIPENWKRYVGMDYGLSAAFAGYFIAIDYDGNVYVYKEYYEKGRTAYENGKGMQAMYYKDDKPTEKIRAFFIDPSVFARTSSGETIAEVLRRRNKDDNYHGLPVVPASNRRVDGWNSLKEYLKHDNGKPNLYIFSNCVKLIEYLPQMIHDKYKPEDLDTTMEDHALDALRYVIQTLRDGKTKRPLKNAEQRLLNKFKKLSIFNPNTYYGGHK